MKLDIKNLGVYAFAGFAAWYALKSTKAGSAGGMGIFDVLRGQRVESGSGIAQNTQKVSEIFNGLGGQFENGWRYFDDGTAIDPSGSYYSGGKLIWSPA